jgi:hypothetical protein
MEVAERPSGEGGRLAAAAVGLDVSADREFCVFGVHWFSFRVKRVLAAGLTSD